MEYWSTNLPLYNKKHRNKITVHSFHIYTHTSYYNFGWPRIKEGNSTTYSLQNPMGTEQFSIGQCTSTEFYFRKKINAEPSQSQFQDYSSRHPRIIVGEYFNITQSSICKKVWHSQLV